MGALKKIVHTARRSLRHVWHGSILTGYGLSVLFFPTTAMAQYDEAFSSGGAGTIVIAGGVNVFVIVRVELWGDGVSHDPSLAQTWEQGVEAIWNGSTGARKYKCYTVQYDVQTLVASDDRTDPLAGTAGYHQIWVPDVLTGDMANSFTDYGLYQPPSVGVASGGEGYAYGEYDPTKAQEYYENNPNIPQEVKDQGRGQIRGFVVNPSDIGNDAAKPATWGTIPNNAYIETVAHEFGHLMGLFHDDRSCDNSIMGPQHRAGIQRDQVYPKHLRAMLDDIGFKCQWTVRSEITMTTPSGIYTPAGLQGYSEVILQEQDAADEQAAYPATGEAAVKYNYITKEFQKEEFGWVPHDGKLSYTAELFYNLKEDLENGGRLLVQAKLPAAPYEELTYIKGRRLDPFDLQGAVTHHTNLQFALDGTNLTVTPYTHQPEHEVKCPAQAETPIEEDIYLEGVLIEGAHQGASAEHFPNSKLYTAEFDYDVTIIDAYVQ